MRKNNVLPDISMSFSFSLRKLNWKKFNQLQTNVNVITRQINERHQNKQVSRRYLLELVKKFQETGNLSNNKTEIEGPVINKAREIAVLGHLDPILRTRQLTAVSRIRWFELQPPSQFEKEQIPSILNTLSLGTYWGIMSARAVTDPQLIFNTYFSDECIFFMGGCTYRYNAVIGLIETPEFFTICIDNNGKK